MRGIDDWCDTTSGLCVGFDGRSWLASVTPIVKLLLDFPKLSEVEREAMNEVEIERASPPFDMITILNDLIAQMDVRDRESRPSAELVLNELKKIDNQYEARKLLHEEFDHVQRTFNNIKKDFIEASQHNVINSGKGKGGGGGDYVVEQDDNEFIEELIENDVDEVEEKGKEEKYLMVARIQEGFGGAMCAFGELAAIAKCNLFKYYFLKIKSNFFLKV